jgi:hypothetical protein
MWLRLLGTGGPWFVSVLRFAIVRGTSVSAAADPETEVLRVSCAWLAEARTRQLEARTQLSATITGAPTGSHL